jgi:ketosteroid isomerase-like protein
MNPNEQLIEEFYAAFAAGNARTMASCYHPDVVFEDPVFGILKGQDVSDMWQMLIERSKGNLKIEFSNVSAHGDSGAAQWVATYHFSKTNRQVVNKIGASFQFRDGLINRHTDHFNLWKWCQQALGFSGLLLGWTGFMQRKIRQQALESLRKYQAAKG